MTCRLGLEQNSTGGAEHGFGREKLLAMAVNAESAGDKFVGQRLLAVSVYTVSKLSAPL
jgi:hypothetical protein